MNSIVSFALGLITNSDALVFDNPQAPLRGFDSKHAQGPREQGTNRRYALRWWTQNPYAGMHLRRVEPYVGKIEVQCYEDALLTPANFEQLFVGATDDAFGKYGMNIVTGTVQQGIGLARNVFVELETPFHAGKSGRHGQHALTSEIRCIGNRRRYVLGFE